MRLILFFLSCCVGSVFSQSNPAISAWQINVGQTTGFGGFVTNVKQVQYSANNVYVSTDDIASWTPEGYDWPNNPWFPEPQHYVFKITLQPKEKTGQKTTTPYGHIGLWANGVSIYNPKDAKSWQNANVWFQNALYFEHIHLQTFDDCWGHPNNMHEYHTHVNPSCLYDYTDSTHHSPLIGFAFDGFPIYGAYGYDKPDGSGGPRRMRSSYRKRNITERTTLPDGTVLTADKYGPSTGVYPLGAYIEDFEYAAGLGDLDQYNGRFCQTPEYPDGIYAYFVTLDEQLAPAFPYILGLQYYGVVQPGNTGPNSGQNTINEPVEVFVSVNEAAPQMVFEVNPNPVTDFFNLYIDPSYQSNILAQLFDNQGRMIFEQPNIQSAVAYPFDVSQLSSGMYYLRLSGDGFQGGKMILVH